MLVKATAFAILTFSSLFVLFLIQQRVSFSLDNTIPDFGRYEQLVTLKRHQFPLDDPTRRVIITGDIHGMHSSLLSLFDHLKYNPTNDVFIHAGDIVAKGPSNGSHHVLQYMTENNITGVRGNHDQKVIEWRGWIEWIQSSHAGREWLDHYQRKWDRANIDGEDLVDWIKHQIKKADKQSAKWWDRVPEDWRIFGEHYNVARDMTPTQFKYLASLPLRIHVPSAHLVIVHAGVLPSDPRYPIAHKRQPLARAPKLPDSVDPGNDTIAVLRSLQESAVLQDVPQNTDPWVVLNMRGVKKERVTRRQDGTPWSELWNRDIGLCNGFEDELGNDSSSGEHTTKTPKSLPCYPYTVVYGHAASRGLDLRRWSIGLDSGCVYGKKLSALVLGAGVGEESDGSEEDEGDEEEDVRFSQEEAETRSGDAGNHSHAPSRFRTQVTRVSGDSLVLQSDFQDEEMSLGKKKERKGNSMFRLKPVPFGDEGRRGMIASVKCST